jgi:hypothetical protein
MFRKTHIYSDTLLRNLIFAEDIDLILVYPSPKEHKTCTDAFLVRNVEIPMLKCYVRIDLTVHT